MSPFFCRSEARTRCAVTFLLSSETALRSWSSPAAEVVGSVLWRKPREAWKLARFGSMASAFWICARASARSPLATAMLESRAWASALFGSMARTALACSVALAACLPATRILPRSIRAGRLRRLKIDGAHQFAVCGHHRPLLDKDFGELIVGLGEVMVDFEGVGELDRRLLELALVGIAFAAFEVPLLLLVGITMTTHGQTKRKRYRQDC